VRVGPKRPSCDEEIRLEAPLYVSVQPEGGGATEFYRVRGGRTTDVVLGRKSKYELSVRMGKGPEAPVIASYYRLESGSLFVLRGFWLGGLDEDPATRVQLRGDELSVEALDGVFLETAGPGLRELRFQISPCYVGGARLARSPLEARVPLAVR
jgi:hypothetical protein